MNTAEDMVLKLNMGWGLTQISEQSGIPVRTVEQMIVAQVRIERITERQLAFGRS